MAQKMPIKLQELCAAPHSPPPLAPHTLHVSPVACCFACFACALAPRASLADPFPSHRTRSRLACPILSSNASPVRRQRQARRGGDQAGGPQLQVGHDGLRRVHLHPRDGRAVRRHHRHREPDEHAAHARARGALVRCCPLSPSLPLLPPHQAGVPCATAPRPLLSANWMPSRETWRRNAAAPNRRTVGSRGRAPA